MKAGDYVCFPAGQKAGHCLINEGAEPARYVILGEHNPNEVAVYPDSNKVMLRALGRRVLLDLAARRNYWDGENMGLPPAVPPPSDLGDAALSTDQHFRPIASGNVPWDEEPSRGSRFGGRSKRLTRAALGSDAYHVGVRIEAPAPGKRLGPNHYHLLEEEQALILEGQVTLLWGDERYEMKAGDFVCFPAGVRVGHSFMNSGDGPCSYLMIGERNPADVCVYPDSNKVWVGPLQNSGSTLLDLGATRTYWDGEQTD